MLSHVCLSDSTSAACIRLRQEDVQVGIEGMHARAGTQVAAKLTTLTQVPKAAQHAQHTEAKWGVQKLAQSVPWMMKRGDTMS